MQHLQVTDITGKFELNIKQNFGSPVKKHRAAFNHPLAVGVLEAPRMKLADCKINYLPVKLHTRFNRVPITAESVVTNRNKMVAQQLTVVRHHHNDI